MKKNVLEYLENTVLQYRDKIALMEGRRELTFGEWEQYAKRLSSFIRSRTEDTKRPIAVFLPKSIDSLVAFMGILYSGNIYAPLDVHSPAVRTHSILEHLEDPLVVTADEYTEALLAMGVLPENIIAIEAAYDEGIVYDNAIALTNVDPLLDTDPIYIIHTSGSTGTPKGVVISHRSVIDYIEWARERFSISSKEIIGSQAPFYFDNSILDIYLCLATGATLVIIPEQHFTFAPELMDYVVSKNINFIFWVPSVLINVANRRALDHVDASNLQKVLFCGEVMPNKHLNYWRNKLPGALFANLYGPTEITDACTFYVVERPFEDIEKLPIGFPCRNTDVIILNDEDQPVKESELGELCVRGSSLALGYWNDPVKSERVFMQNPLNTHYADRIYRTGDLVYRNEYNEIICVGRKDSQIKHLGYRIELGEIENALLSMDGIHNSCVLYNKQNEEITMFYEGSSELSAAAIRNNLKLFIPKYMIPTKIMKYDHLPLNKNGKIDRKILENSFYEGCKGS